MARWWLALVGLSLFVSAVVGLSGPGRIDIVDGQTRYEVARSLVEYGDHVIRDERVWFGVFPGRDGRSYTYYRFPQSAAGALAILCSDATGPVSEARRYYFFSLTGAFACAFLAVAYAVLFCHLGHEPRGALLWAGAGIFCTPSWFYGTSTYDDILGTTALVLAVTLALMSRHRRPLLGAAAAGLMLGLAFNCKQPLGVFVLAILAASYDRGQSLRQQSFRVVLVLAGLAIGIAAYKGYDLYKYPPGTVEGHAELLQKYAPNWPGHPLAAILALAFSPGTGVFLYCPPLLICLYGIRAWYRDERWFCLTVLAATTIFVLFVSSMTIFKGDPSWGPRYLTPVFALLWIFAPAGARLLPQRLVATLLALGLVVQLGALSVDPHRLYLERRLPSAFYLQAPWLYFDPAISHLANRPREIIEILAARGEKAGRFSPSPSPLFAFPVIDFIEKGPEAIRNYHVLNSFRPWWISQRHLTAGRPIALGRTALLLVLLAASGLAMQTLALFARPRMDRKS
ncbi:hypothetical protein V5E97_37510 [Singulisphaera sp. Ch08]|uniref:Glycosyltransferase RgtA/B/C/D-like domain-containing protein n=1 Tax=Singulisphaera sp. Ch08 TaxID=3120278 RepID=A0AAU7CFK4_9BACT